jgi:hypothetical protein
VTAALGHKKHNVELSMQEGLYSELKWGQQLPCLGKDNNFVHKNKTYIIMLLIRAISIYGINPFCVHCSLLDYLWALLLLARQTIDRYDFGLGDTRNTRRSYKLSDANVTTQNTPRKIIPIPKI